MTYVPKSNNQNGSTSYGAASVAILRPALCDPMDGSPVGSSVHGISQARLLEWVAISFSGVSSRPRDRTQVFSLAGGFFTY